VHPYEFSNLPVQTTSLPPNLKNQAPQPLSETCMGCVEKIHL
jgi:hypothetical protein